MAHGGMPDTTVYTISKATLDAVTHTAANQLKDAQIR
jgi:NAD(P)-dependent dehydrogenase (short-subunit alcohol dehydrogenase family)